MVAIGPLFPTRTIIPNRPLATVSAFGARAGRGLGGAGSPRGDFSTPSFGFADGRLTRTGAAPTPQEQAVTGLLAGQRGTLAGIRGNISALRPDLRQLRAEVRPGFGRLTAARVQAIENARERARGDLRAQFAARNLLGASFAQGEILSSDLQFAQEEERARAEAAIEELQASSALIQQELGLSEAEANVAAQELENIQTQLATVQEQNDRELAELGITADFITNLNSIEAEMAIAEAELSLRERLFRGGTGIRLGPSNVFGANRTGIDRSVPAELQRIPGVVASRIGAAQRLAAIPPQSGSITSRIVSASNPRRAAGVGTRIPGV